MRVGRGRRRQIERAFIANSWLRSEHWHFVRLLLAEASPVFGRADPIGRSSTKGRPWLWRLRPENQALVSNCDSTAEG
jgi:hypothetical protein